MLDAPDIAPVAVLLGDPTRGRMLALLMDGRAQTATELALEGGVTASTASSHLARLTDAGLLTVVQQGRHRYFRIASPEVAATIEALMSIAARRGFHATRTGPSDDGLREARVCYDHLAGRAGVRLMDRLRARGIVDDRDGAVALTPEGEVWCDQLGVDLAAMRSRRRPLCRPCLDWSERRMHLGGALGAALLDRMFALHCARRVPESRAVVLSSRGESFVERLELAR